MILLPEAQSAGVGITGLRVGEGGRRCTKVSP
jgi:hypothetical protein